MFLGEEESYSGPITFGRSTSVFIFLLTKFRIWFSFCFVQLRLVSFIDLLSFGLMFKAHHSCGQMGGVVLMCAKDQPERRTGEGRSFCPCRLCLFIIKASSVLFEVIDPRVKARGGGQNLGRDLAKF